MNRRWIEAGGEHQTAFFNATSRILDGASGIPCPKCGQAELRFYFHIMNPSKGTGTVWVWCPACRTTTHLPRVTPRAKMPLDPFASLDLEAFARLETGGEPLLDQLDRLWTEGTLSQ